MGRHENPCRQRYMPRTFAVKEFPDIVSSLTIFKPLRSMLEDKQIFSLNAQELASQQEVIQCNVEQGALSDNLGGFSVLPLHVGNEKSSRSGNSIGGGGERMEPSVKDG